MNFVIYIHLLVRSQPLLESYSTKTVRNNSTELLIRVFINKMIQVIIPVIIVYDLTVGYSMYLDIVG